MIWVIEYLGTRSVDIDNNFIRYLILIIVGNKFWLVLLIMYKSLSQNSFFCISPDFHLEQRSKNLIIIELFFDVLLIGTRESVFLEISEVFEQRVFLHLALRGNIIVNGRIILNIIFLEALVVYFFSLKLNWRVDSQFLKSFEVDSCEKRMSFNFLCTTIISKSLLRFYLEEPLQ